jgi:predicted transglutaminase-like cysteine proteinase
MARRSLTGLAVFFLLSGIFTSTAAAANHLSREADVRIAEASPILAPFQHVRFCLRYPADCKSDPTESSRIDLNDETSKLLATVNRDVNAAISPMVKGYGAELQDGWTISPLKGDCNDYAVTKRHELLQKGLSSKALRLSVVQTTSGLGHLVLVVVTTTGDVVLDNLTENIRPWQETSYHWLKIQSTTDARLWYEVKAPSLSLAQADSKIHLADR